MRKAVAGTGVAILVGNVEYRALTRLDCCRADMTAIRDLLSMTQKYGVIEVIENADAIDLKSKIRAVLGKVSSPAELIFYFTGHGFSYEDEFFHCATNFDFNRPNVYNGSPYAIATRQCRASCQSRGRM